MTDEKTDLDKYLEMTGQSIQELMSGANQVGPSYIIDELIPQALNEKKKIVWVVENEDLATGDYVLEDL